MPPDGLRNASSTQPAKYTTPDMVTIVHSRHEILQSPDQYVEVIDTSTGNVTRHRHRRRGDLRRAAPGASGSTRETIACGLPAPSRSPGWWPIRASDWIYTSRSSPGGFDVYDVNTMQRVAWVRRASRPRIRATSIPRRAWSTPTKATGRLSACTSPRGNRRERASRGLRPRIGWLAVRHTLPDRLRLWAIAQRPAGGRRRCSLNSRTRAACTGDAEGLAQSACRVGRVLFFGDHRLRGRSEAAFPMPPSGSSQLEGYETGVSLRMER